LPMTFPMVGWRRVLVAAMSDGVEQGRCMRAGDLIQLPGFTFLDK
jgi:hypothetical protein